MLNEINSWTVNTPVFPVVNGFSPDSLNRNIFSLKRLFLTHLFHAPEIQLACKKWIKAEIDPKHSDYKVSCGMATYKCA
jgi:hypothetical protein